MARSWSGSYNATMVSRGFGFSGEALRRAARPTACPEDHMNPKIGVLIYTTILRPVLTINVYPILYYLSIKVGIPLPPNKVQLFGQAFQRQTGARGQRTHQLAPDRAGSKPMKKTCCTLTMMACARRIPNFLPKSPDLILPCYS